MVEFEHSAKIMLHAVTRKQHTVPWLHHHACSGSQNSCTVHWMLGLRECIIIAVIIMFCLTEKYYYS